MQGFTVKRTTATPKAFANLSPGLEHRDNPGIRIAKRPLNPEGVNCCANPFRVENIIKRLPRVVAMLQPWARISERLRRIVESTLR